MFRDPLVGVVLFAIAAGSTPAQVNLPHPISQLGLVLEYDRAIYTIQRGIALQWSDPELYLHAFDRISRTGTGGEQLPGEYDVVRRRLAAQLSSFPHTSTVWDEQPCMRANPAYQSVSRSRWAIV